MHAIQPTRKPLIISLSLHEALSSSFKEEDLTQIQDVSTKSTSIAYKGIQSESDRSKALNISTEISVSILGGMIDLSGSGSYVDTSHSNVKSCEVNEKAKGIAKSHEFKLYGDDADAEQPNTTTVGGVLETVTNQPKIMCQGVPCEIILTDVNQFIDGDAEANILHELESQELMDICAIYDDLFRLVGRRTKLVDTVENGIGGLCPGR
ncbi:hypothetical protein NEOLEDRAFT_1183606 [Neolentinus lepideus HHB14362 ss-1]|uniref:Uncharacterized protein n=1 Tax=Neolentinus lepideus HHB14362 ss-1 TaxID=1314782 RepID=A0A165N4A9_9AGAM|nr:hypothetical protein NEOLEDRAFT_1183606 [Neolentinus lepideus HHB14362 ss-1]